MFNKIFTIVFGLVIATSVWYANGVEAQEIVTDGLISLWTLDRSDINGKTVKDLSGGNDGTIQGSLKMVDGKIEEALDGKNLFKASGITATITYAGHPILGLLAGAGLLVGNTAIKLMKTKLEFEDIERGPNSEISWVYEAKKL